MIDPSTKWAGIDLSTPLASLCRKEIRPRHPLYKRVKVVLQVCNAQLCHVEYTFNNSFKGVSLADLEQIARMQMTNGKLVKVNRMERMPGQKDPRTKNVLEITIEITGTLLADGIRQALEHLNELGTRVGV